MVEQINILKHRLVRVIRDDVKPFGFEHHKMKLNPPIATNELTAIEEKYSIELPADYRHFLLNICNGGAGPGYGLESVQNAITYERHFVPSDILSCSFDHNDNFNPSDVDELENIYGLCDEGKITDEELDKKLAYVNAGTLVLCHEGCGYLHRLIITGPERGSVWIDAEVSDQGYFSLGINFYEWYEKWIENIENGGNGVWWLE